MAIDPKTTTVKTLYLSHELAARIASFRFGNEIRSEAEAIRLLIEAGLDAKGVAKRVQKTRRG